MEGKFIIFFVVVVEGLCLENKIQDKRMVSEIRVKRGTRRVWAS